MKSIPYSIMLESRPGGGHGMGIKAINCNKQCCEVVLYNKHHQILFSHVLKVVCKTSEEKDENHGSGHSRSKAESEQSAVHITGSRRNGHKINIIITKSTLSCSLATMKQNYLSYTYT
jgi:hypothetical protein